MPKLNAGLVIPRGNARDVVDAIVQAESRGVRTVWSTVGATSPSTVVSYGAAAHVTSVVTLGTSIVPTYPIHPLALASETIALENLAPGRVRLGVGPSHKPTIEGQFGLPMGTPLDHLREYVTILRDVLWTGRSAFQGAYFQVDFTLPESVTRPQTPILVSALRQNAFRLAGEVADGALSWVAPIPYLVREALPAITEGAALANRPVPPIVAHVPVAASTDREAARAAFRAQFPYYSKLPFYQRMFAAAGFPVTASEEMTDELVDELLVSGSEDAIAQRLEAIHAEGIAEIYISPVLVHDAGQELATLSAIIAE